MPKHELRLALDQMDLQLATSMKRPIGGDYCLASKSFDYLLARKPIVAVVTEGSQKDFLEASGAAVMGPRLAGPLRVLAAVTMVAVGAVLLAGA